MVVFVDHPRRESGVESICALPPIAPFHLWRKRCRAKSAPGVDLGPLQKSGVEKHYPRNYPHTRRGLRLLRRSFQPEGMVQIFDHIFSD